MKIRSTLAQLLADPGSSAPAIISTSPLAVVSYRALAEQVERLSGQLRGAGLKAGDCVAIVLPNSLEFLVVFLALTHARLFAAPQSGRQAWRNPLFIEDAQARAVIAERARFGVMEATAGLGLPIWQPRVDSPGVVELPELPQGSRPSIDAPNPDDIALFAYTSGTTGRPKCVPLTRPDSFVLLREPSAQVSSGHFSRPSQRKFLPEEILVVALPLEGIKVIDFTSLQAGPACAQLLAWFGADVLKIERPGVGDVTRNQLRDIPNLDALYFITLNSNKKSLTLNTKRRKARRSWRS
jgi:acyl-CoA synthetase (AMP-forming)/AMP-acid ligase II